MMPLDYYQLLKIDPAATFDQIHKAYRMLAMQYHPDRNSGSDACSMMMAINEAYSVLGDPSRRRAYDQERSSSEPEAVSASILRAAYETLLKQGWIVTQNRDRHFILEKGSRAVRVSLVPRLDNTLLKKISRQFAGFSVVLAVEIELPLNLSFHTAIIDLMHSRHHGAPFPDDVYRNLFSAFGREFQGHIPNS